MAIQTQVWIRELTKRLYPNDLFFDLAKNDSAFVENRTVSLPQRGGAPGVQKNRSVYPATATRRSDAVLEYTIDEFTTDPTHVPDIEQIEVSYDKRSSILEDHANELNLKMANSMLEGLAPSSASQIIRSTGVNIDANLAGATGTRKLITIDDFVKVRQIMDDMDIPEKGRCVVIPSNHLNELVNREKSVLMSKDFRNDADIKEGVLYSLFGIKIIKRGKNNVMRYNNAGTPAAKAFGVAGAATDNAAAIFWHKDFVRKANGAVKVYQKTQDPLYYGDVFSAMVRFGVSPAYTDGTGIVAVVEAAGA